jgi:hypothetical protein
VEPAKPIQSHRGPLEVGAKECTPVPEQRIDKRGAVGVELSEVPVSSGLAYVAHQNHEQQRPDKHTLGVLIAGLFTPDQ